MKEKRNKLGRSSSSTDKHLATHPFSLVFAFSNNILPETCDSFLSEYRLFYLTWWFVVRLFTHKWHNFIHIKIPYISAQKCHYETHHFIDFSDSKWWTDLFVLHMKNVHKSSMALENSRQYRITAKIKYAVRLQAQLPTTCKINLGIHIGTHKSLTSEHTYHSTHWIQDQEWSVKCAYVLPPQWLSNTQ